MDERNRKNQIPAAVSVEDALQRVLSVITSVPSEIVPIGVAIGRELAHDVVAPANLPGFTNAAMDGYAVIAASTLSASGADPCELPVVGSTRAGDSGWHQALELGQALKIMTGAPLPPGADAVIPFELVTESADRIMLTVPASIGDHIRVAGSEIATGEIAIPSGRKIGWIEIALLVALGVERISVSPQLRVAIVSTGDELASLRDAAAEFTVFDSNGPMLRAMVTASGATATSLGIAGDTLDAVRTKVSQASDFDLLIVTGGVSTGDYDLVRELLETEGELVVSQVRMKPGRPFTFVMLGNQPVFALPGNPTAAAVSFLQFVLPALQKMAGFVPIGSRTIRARLGTSVRNSGRRRLFVPVTMQRMQDGPILAERLPAESANGLAGFARADGLLVIPEDEDGVESGAMVTIWPFRI